MLDLTVAATLASRSGSSRTTSLSSSAAAKRSVPIGDRSSWLAARLNAFRSLVLLLDRRGVFADEGVHGRPHQHADGARQAALDFEAFGDRRLQAEALGFLDQKGLEDLAEDLVLVQQLMRRGVLSVAQLAELARLVHHGGVGGDLLVRRRGDVAGDLVDQRRGCDRAAARTETLRWR